MQTATLRYATEDWPEGEGLAGTTIGLAKEAEPDRNVLRLSVPSQAKLCGSFPRAILAAVLTVPVRYFNPHADFRLSGSYSRPFHLVMPSHHRISLSQARELALRILAETERNLREERISEARLFNSLWDTDQP
jgi:hypothetical protein